MLSVVGRSRFEETAWSDPNECSQTRKTPVLSNSYNFSVDIRMPAVIPAAVRSCKASFLNVLLTAAP